MATRTWTQSYPLVEEEEAIKLMAVAVEGIAHHPHPSHLQLRLPPPPRSSQAKNDDGLYGLSDAVDIMSLVTRFSPNYRLPFHLQWTSLMEGYRFCYLNFPSSLF
jgi:hypothetical protein